MPRIVLVEDDGGTRTLLRHILEGGGYTVVAAWNGQDALPLVRELRPDAVITDLLMPHMGGIELCTHLRDDPDTWDIPIVMITGSADPAAVRRKVPYLAATMGKPFWPETVLKVVDVVVRARQPLCPNVQDA